MNLSLVYGLLDGYCTPVCFSQLGGGIGPWVDHFFSLSLICKMKIMTVFLLNRKGKSSNVITQTNYQSDFLTYCLLSEPSVKYLNSSGLLSLKS